MATDLSTLTDEQLQAVASGKLDQLPDDVLEKLAKGSSPSSNQAVAPSSNIPSAPANPNVGTGDSGTAAGIMAGATAGQMLPAGALNTIKNMGLEGGGAALGQTLGAPLGPIGSGIGGAVLGAAGNAIGQLTTPNKSFSFPEVLGAAATDWLPGASLAKAGGKELAIAAAKGAGANLLGANVTSLAEGNGLASPTQDLTAAGAGALAAPISKFLDTGNAAQEAANKASQDSVRRETLNAGRSLGLVVPPSVTNPNPLTNTINSLGGKAAVAQEAVLRNQPKINAAVKAEIGLPDAAPLSPISLNTARVAPNLVYGEVAAANPQAAGLLDQFKNATDEARKLFSAYRSSLQAGTPNNNLLAQARQASADADVYKNGIKAVIPSPLFAKFDGAREQLAKIGMAERALNVGDGNIDASVLGHALDAGEKLTGNLRTIAKFQNAFSKYVKEAATTPPSGVDHLKMAARPIAGGGLGYAVGGVPGAIAGTALMTAAEGGARKLALNPTFQRKFSSPFYGQPNAADFQAALGQYATMAAGR